MSEVQRLENHWLGCMAQLGGGARVTRLPGALAVTNRRFGLSLVNFLTLRGASSATLDATLQLGSALLSEAGCPPALYLSPLAGDQEELRAGLRDRGWHAGHRQVVLSLSLPAHAVAEEGPAHVRPVGERELGRWARLLGQAYGVAGPTARLLGRAWTDLYADPGEAAATRYVMAWYENVPVGTGLTWTQGGVAALYCGAVLPAYRRRGVERASLLHRLRQAASDGASVALVQTEEGSPVEHLCLDRLGFRLAYRREVWLPARIPGPFGSV